MGNKQGKDGKPYDSGEGASAAAAAAKLSGSALTPRENMAAWLRSGVSVTDVYDIVEVLGQGHMGEVYKVRRKVEDRGMHNETTRQRANTFGDLEDEEDQHKSDKNSPKSPKSHKRSKSPAPKSALRQLKKKVGVKKSKSSSADKDKPTEYSLAVSEPEVVKKEPPNPKQVPAPKPILRKRTTTKEESGNSDDDVGDNDVDDAKSVDSTRSLGALTKSDRIKAGGVRFRRNYACKTVHTSRVKAGYMDELMNEIAVMRNLDHPYILQLSEVYQWKRKTWIITELCTGGDLASRKLDEPETVVVTEQILRAVTYMHLRGVVHRDIKLENILYEHNASEGKLSDIRLIDFGLSQTFNRAEKGHRAVATAYTMSPEQAAGADEYTEKTDVWSIGVVVWILLAGDFPFIRVHEELKDPAKLNKLVKAQYEFGITWSGRGISMEAKEFVKKCLKERPEDRWTAKEALNYVQHTWIPTLAKREGAKAKREAEEMAKLFKKDSKYAKASENPTTPSTRLLKQTITSKRSNSSLQNLEAALDMENIQRFCKYGQMKKTILMAMAHAMDRREVGQLREAFLTADIEDTGTINLLELKTALQQINTSVDDETIERIFEGIDQDHSGEIHYAEFVAALLESQGLVTMERLAEAFDRMDTAGKGYISHDDLRSILGKDYDKSMVDAMIEEADFKKNGQVDYDELLQLMFQDPEKLDEMVPPAVSS